MWIDWHAQARAYSVLALLLMSLVLSVSCSRSSDNTNGDSNVSVVNSPAAGVVKRILVAEGVRINAGTPIVEITVQSVGPVAAPKPGENAESQAVRSYKAADAEIEAARAEAVRHEAEVARLTPLVASGEASQGQLDGERGLYEQAQRRLQQAQEARRAAEGGLIAARQPGQAQTNNAPPPREETVPAIATSPGTVSVIGVRVGERVTAGQALATVRGGS